MKLKYYKEVAGQVELEKLERKNGEVVKVRWQETSLYTTFKWEDYAKFRNKDFKIKPDQGQMPLYIVGGFCLAACCLILIFRNLLLRCLNGLQALILSNRFVRRVQTEEEGEAETENEYD